MHIRTIFFPKLHRKVKNTTHGDPETTLIVVGNKTPYASIQETVVLYSRDLLRMVMFPVQDKENINLLMSVKEWHDGSFKKCIPPAWLQVPLEECALNPEDIQLMYIPVSFPIVLGYNWTDYPLRLSKPANWENILQNRERTKKYERVYREKKSSKIKELKGDSEEKYEHLSMADDLSFDFANTLRDNDYNSVADEEETDYVEVKWFDMDTQVMCKTDHFDAWAAICQDIIYHIMLETDWEDNAPPSATRQDIVWKDHKNFKLFLTFPQTLYNVIHILIERDTTLQIITADNDRIFNVSRMSIATTGIPNSQDRHHSLKMF